MADTQAATGLTRQEWDDKFFREYMQENRFKPYMGQKTNSVIQVKENFRQKKGDQLHFALVNRLKADATTGSDVLEGNEERLDTRSHAQRINKRRHAVRVSAMEEQKSAIGLRNAAREELLDWAMEDTRDRIIEQLGAVTGVNPANNGVGSIPLPVATAAQRDAWTTTNEDRIIFGNANANFSGTHGTGMSNITSSMSFTSGVASQMKRMALAAQPKIRPLRVNGGRRFFVVFCGTRTFRDIKQDPTITNAQRDVGIRMQNNKLFKGGDIEWDGMIFHEIDDIPLYAVADGMGNTTDVEPVYLCGAQAISYAGCERWTSVTEAFDYGDKNGVEIHCIDGFGKMQFGTGTGDTDDKKDHGIVTGYMAAAPDA
ncbi:MAG: DUF4043 family protein [Pseudomonadota bacterium]